MINISQLTVGQRDDGGKTRLAIKRGVVAPRRPRIRFMKTTGFRDLNFEQDEMFAIDKVIYMCR